MSSALAVADAVVEGARLLQWVREAGGQNIGFFVQHIQASTGNGPGDSWCASFVYYVGRTMLGPRWLSPRTASCTELLRYGRTQGLVVYNEAGFGLALQTGAVTEAQRAAMVSAPMRGDVFLRMTSGAEAHHTGFVTAPLDLPTLPPSRAGRAFGTIEGNAANPALPPSNNGDGVYERSRDTVPDTGYAFLRWHLTV